MRASAGAITAARLAGRGNFRVFCLNVAGIDVGYFNDKRSDDWSSDQHLIALFA